MHFTHTLCLVLVLILTLVFSTCGSNEVFAPPTQTLVLLCQTSLKQTHSQFLNILQSRLNVKIQDANDKDISLEEFGEWKYKSVMILCPDAERLPDGVKSSQLLEFVDSGHNLFIAASSKITAESIREMAAESGLEFDYDQSQIIDYFHQSSSDSSWITTSQSPLVSTDKDIAYRGMSMIFSQKPSQNPLLLSLLNAESTAFSYIPNEPITDEPNCQGSSCILVAGLQARNGARMTWSGSIDLFSDEVLNDQSLGNEQFVQQLILWSFGLRGVLRYRNVEHSRVTPTPDADSMYTIEEDIKFSVIIEEYDGIQDKWIPFHAKDIQLEFIMLDPYVRLTLNTTNNDGVYTAQFKVPDTYGVFQFRIDYRRPLFTPLYASIKQTVRPYKLDQFERFIPAAYPYYLAMGSMMIGFLIFSVLFLYAPDEKLKKE